MKKIFLTLATISILFATLSSAWAVSEINLYFPPEWKHQPEEAYKISDGLSNEVGIRIIPQIADCYPEILTALSRKKPVIVYVGSMVQTIVLARKLGAPLLQALDHKQYYGGVLIYPQGKSPSVILNDFPAEVAYTVGSTAGEVCAKVATRGKASIAVTDQRAAVDAIRSGEARGAFVKNTWWDENRNEYPEFGSYRVRGVSNFDNADNVLLVSNYVSPEIKSLIMAAAIKAPHIFNASLVVPFDSFFLWYTQKLMKRAGIDPLTYTWPVVDPGQCGNEPDIIPQKRPDVSPAKPPAPVPQNDQTLSSGEMVLEKYCSKCHLLEKVRKYRRKTKEQWEATIIKKRYVGVELTETEHAELINYLLSLKRKKN